MKRTVRYGTFETNSSSEHTLVVFDDPGIREMWMGSPDLFLDLRDAEWVGDSDDYSGVFFVTADHVISRGDVIWGQVLARRVEEYNEAVADLDGAKDLTIEDVAEAPTEMAIGQGLLPAEYWKASEYSSWDGWGVKLFDYDVEDWSPDIAKEYAAGGYDILQVTVGDNH